MNRVSVVLVALVTVAGCEKGKSASETAAAKAPTAQSTTTAKPATPTAQLASPKLTTKLAGLYDLPTSIRYVDANEANYLIVTVSKVTVGQRRSKKKVPAIPGTRTPLDQLSKWMDKVRILDVAPDRKVPIRSAIDLAGLGDPPPNPKTGLKKKPPNPKTGLRKKPPNPKTGSTKKIPARGRYSMKRTDDTPQSAKRRPNERGALSVLKAVQGRAFASLITKRVQTVRLHDGILASSKKLTVMAWGPGELPPLLLADKQLSASRVAAVLSHLCSDGAHLAIAKIGDTKVYRHMVKLGTYNGTGCKADTTGRVKRSHVAVIAIELSKTGMKVVVDGKQHQLGDYNAVKTVVTLNKLLSGKGYIRLFVAVAKDVQVHTLVSALDVFAAARLYHVHLASDFARAKQGATERGVGPQ